MSIRLKTRDVQEDAAPEDGSHGVDRQALQAAGVGLRDFAAIVQLAVAREMAERVDVRAHVAAEGERFRCRASARGRDVLAVLFHQAEQVRRMHGMMRHADEIRLGEVVEFGGVEESEQIGHKKSGYRRLKNGDRQHHPRAWEVEVLTSRHWLGTGSQSPFFDGRIEVA